MQFYKVEKPTFAPAVAAELPSEEPKRACVDCKHGDWTAAGLCKHPNHELQTWDAVLGWTFRAPSLNRGQYGKCGQSGKYWEPKEPPQWPIAVATRRYWPFVVIALMYLTAFVLAIRYPY